MTRTYEYRCLPKRSQERYLSWCLEPCRVLYNAGLAERIDEYQRKGLTLTPYDQMKTLTQARARHDDWDRMFVQFQRGALKNLHLAFKGFFRRAKSGDGKVGFPRFKGKGRVRSFYMAKGGTYRHKHGKWYTLKIEGMETKIPVYHHRPLPDGTLRLRRLAKDHKGWKVQMVLELPAPKQIPVDGAIGIDVGLKHFYTDSDGTTIPNPRFLQKRLKEELVKEQQALSRKARGSHGRAKQRQVVSRLHAKIRQRRRDFHITTARSLVEKARSLGKSIAGEDLGVQDMMQKDYGKHIGDVGWGTVFHWVDCKAESAGVLVVKVEARGTSQTCSGCGATVKKTLRDRKHTCLQCGLSIDRDYNAARNIQHRGGNAPGSHALLPSERGAEGHASSWL